MSFLVIQKHVGGWGGSLVEEHAAFMRKVKDQLIAFGPLTSDGEGVAGYAYFTRHDAASDVSAFVLEDPLSGSAETICHPWRSRLDRTQVNIPPRPGRQGFFMWGLGTPDAPQRREALHAAHAAYFRKFDPDHFVARGPILATDQQSWRGSAVAIEVENRSAFDTYINNEPFYQNGLYGLVEIYGWRRGEAAGT